MKPFPPTGDPTPHDPGLQRFADLLARTLDPGDLSLSPAARDEIQAAARRQFAPTTTPQKTAESDPFSKLLADFLDPGEILLDIPRRETIRLAAHHGVRPHELTAWALGELPPHRFLAVEHALAQSKNLHSEASALRSFCDLLWRFTRPIPKPAHGEIRRIERLFHAPASRRRLFASLAGAAAALIGLATWWADPWSTSDTGPATSAQGQSPVSAASPERVGQPLVLPSSRRPSPRAISNPGRGPEEIALGDRSLPPPRPWPALPAADVLPWPRPLPGSTPAKTSPGDESPLQTVARQTPASGNLPPTLEPIPVATPSVRPSLPSLDPAAELQPSPGTLALARPGGRNSATGFSRSPSTPPSSAELPPATANPATAAGRFPHATLPASLVDSTSIRLGDYTTNNNTDPGTLPPDTSNTSGTGTNNTTGSTGTGTGTGTGGSDPPADRATVAPPNLATLTLAGLQPYLLLGFQPLTAPPPAAGTGDDSLVWSATAGFQLLEYDALIGNAGYQADTWSGSASASFPLAPDLRLAAAATRFDSRAEVDAFGDLNLTGSALALALDWTPGPWRLTLMPAFTSFDQQLFRQDLGTWHRADQDASLFSLSLAASRLTEANGWQHGPLVCLDAAWGELDGYLETGPAPLAVGPRSFRSLATLAGWHITGQFGPWSPHATLGWRHEFDSPDSPVTHSTPGGFVVGTPATASPDAILLETGVRWNATDHLSVLASWLCEWRTSGNPDHSLTLTLRCAF